MCTAVTFKNGDFYFGRTLDYEFSYGEQIVITPRLFPLPFRHTKDLNDHFAIIGMAYVSDGYPLYYDAINEKGLCMAGLNFVGNAHYEKVKKGKDNIAQFEFIPWVLSRCENLESARKLLLNINLVDTPFSPSLPIAELHWVIADSSGAITVESTRDGLKVYDNPVGVLTNNPPFNEQMFNLNNYMHLSPKQPKNSFSSAINLTHYSRGMGGLGLPGDLSSQSRFVRASFVKLNSLAEQNEKASVGQFFHILNSVNQTRGCCVLENGKYEITIYSSCSNASKGIYYYTTYNNRQISAVDMNKENLESYSLMCFPLIDDEQIKNCN